MTSRMHFFRPALVLLGGAVLLAGCQGSAAPAGPAGASVAPQTEDQKTYYALGLLIGRNLQQFKLKPDELDFVKAGLSDQALGAKPLVDVTVYGPKVQAMAMARAHAAESTDSAAEKAKAKPFLDNAAKEPGAVVLPSGLVLKTLTPGKGESPKATDRVKVNYEGKLIDGTVFDSSLKRGQPISFPLGQVIPCWTEGVQKMHVGEKAQLVCPAKIAYGDHGAPEGGIPPNATLVFEVHLLGIDTK